MNRSRRKPEVNRDPAYSSAPALITALSALSPSYFQAPVFGTAVCELDTADDLSQGQVSLASMGSSNPFNSCLLISFYCAMYSTYYITHRLIILGNTFLKTGDRKK